MYEAEAVHAVSCWILIIWYILSIKVEGFSSRQPPFQPEQLLARVVDMGQTPYESLSVNGYVINISRTALWWTAAAALIPVICVVVWRCIEKSLNKLAPYEV